MKKAILFDFFGVICSEVIPIWSKQYFPESEIRRIHDEYIVRTDRGELTEHELAEYIGGLLLKSADAIRAEWKTYIQIDGDVVEEIKRLKSTHTIGLCTNAFSSFLNPILEENHMRSLFDATVVSDEIGHVKPDPEMFIAILDRLHVLPSEALFIDDQEKNILGASEVGIEGMLFTSVSQLRMIK